MKCTHCPKWRYHGRPNPDCRCCEGTGHLRYIKWHGRYRTRVEVAKWVLARPEWRGAVVTEDGATLVLTRGSAVMRLEHLTPAELAELKVTSDPLTVNSDAL